MQRACFKIFEENMKVGIYFAKLNSKMAGAASLKTKNSIMRGCVENTKHER